MGLEMSPKPVPDILNDMDKAIELSGEINALSSGVASVLSLVDGVDPVVKFGHCSDAGIQETDMWGLGGTQPIYIFPPASGEGMTIQSSNAADNQVIKTFLLDKTGIEVITDVTLNGLNPVVITGTFRAFNRAFNDDSTEFLGNLLIKGATSGNTFGYVASSEQQTTQCIYTVPSDKYALVRNVSTAINASTNQDAAAAVRFSAQRDGKVFRTQIRYGLQKKGTSNISSDLIIPSLYPPLCRIKISMTPDTTDMDISAEFSVQLIDSDLLESMQVT